ncbi:hypothetical protein JCGZ_19755 [Jatropha curcas]|uniref:Uncharacterized protein n=1 Tax=Jatropha curcas TaxID=180498 RepID=A0A067LBL2_JATCU|nr:hypothetical protein JCGZ_19755 [Jatropha curcas]
MRRSPISCPINEMGILETRNNPIVVKGIVDHGGFTILHRKLSLTEWKISHRGDEMIGTPPSHCNCQKQYGLPETSSRDIT